MSFFFNSCRSFDYGDTGSKVCRLSHHSTSTLLEIEEPYLEAAGATTYELGACYNVTVECKVRRARVFFHTSEIFFLLLWKLTEFIYETKIVIN